MKKTAYFLVVLILLLSFGCKQKEIINLTLQEINIVPEVAEIEMQKGHFTLDKTTHLVFNGLDDSDPTIEYITTHYHSFFGFAPTPYFNKKTVRRAVVFELNKTEDPVLQEEGYRLEINNHYIQINANTTAGLFYGFQTLFQLAPSDIAENKQDKITFPAITVVDYPRFEWRGSHRDVCRHFFDVDHIKKHLDLMALYKLNKFHWHLTDDHGWRLEIDQYPKLTQVGAWSVDRTDVPWREGEPPREGEIATYGGFYTKEEVREVIAYAAQRHIDVIPEIEIPGHSCAILAAYPEFACDDYPYHVAIGPYWPPKAILCGGNDEIITFLCKVLDEVAALFPYEYIHIGGDEALKGNWEKCPKCQKKIKEMNLQNEEELQGWLIREVEEHLAKKDKKIIGWDEILEGGVSQNATVMSWRGIEGGIEAARHGNFAIMTPTSHCYFDYYQADPETEPDAICCYIPIEKVYTFDPVPSELSAEEAKFIKGGQCNLWAEFIYTPEHAQYMLLPRLCALAECVWTPVERKEWSSFEQKLAGQKNRLKTLGYNYCDKIGLIEK